ncbi:DNA modification methylase [Amycolatopsis acididurans]|uniref:DNA modification methylase n=1 Tax=Amycolatopsis acididurans TaxID=2724524 RepID=UPI001FEB7113|nr:DNA modification methylase [Amycolatopsis acididurans]
MPRSAPRPVSVWDTGQHGPRRQLDGRHVGATRADTALTPAVARHILDTYTGPGDTVCDPLPGPGLVLAEAIRAGRNAIGLPTETRWDSPLEANLDMARLAGPVGALTLLDSVDDPRAAQLPGAVDLVLTGVRHTPADDPTRVLVRLYDALDAVADWVWPGGHVVITCRPWRRRGLLVDLPGQIHDAADAVGLVPADHCIALTAPVRGQHVRPRVITRAQELPEFADLHGRTAARPAHIDVLVFRLPPDCPEFRRTEGFSGGTHGFIRAVVQCGPAGSG